VDKGNGVTYCAAIWYDFPDCKKVKQINGSGVSAWWFPERLMAAELSNTAGIFWP
jgi:hypothetical protein